MKVKMKADQDGHKAGETVSLPEDIAKQYVVLGFAEVVGTAVGDGGGSALAAANPQVRAPEQPAAKSAAAPVPPMRTTVPGGPSSPVTKP